MNRRGVIAAIAGAGVFGPKAARDVAQNLAEQSPVPPNVPYPRQLVDGAAGESRVSGEAIEHAHPLGPPG
jgi:hypothetical protein